MAKQKITAVKKKKVSFKYILFWLLGILGAFIIGYFFFVGFGVKK